MSFNRDNLPDTTAYFENAGLALKGPGKWKTTRCEFHGGSDSLRVNTESGGWICMACDAKGGDVLAYEMQSTGTEFVQAAKALGVWVDDDKPHTHVVRRTPVPVKPADKFEPLGDYGRALWAACISLAGTVGEQYLLHRRAVVPPGDLRFHPNLPHKPSGRSGPALVALVTDAITGTPMSLHRTWVTPTGKADLDPPRMTLGNKQGGVIRLWSDEYVTHGLAVAEGIETALSLAHAYQPVWACLDAGNLATLPVLPGVEVLVIAADNDPAGLTGAHTCAARWTAAGVDVRVTQQDTNDLNDELMELTQ